MGPHRRHILLCHLCRWQLIVTGSRDETIKVWDTSTGDVKLTIRGHDGWVKGCAVSTDGTFIVSCSTDQTVRVWDVATGEEKMKLEGHTCAVMCVALSADSATIVSGSNDHTLCVWDVATGQEKTKLEGHEGTVLGCAISADGSLVASVGDWAETELRLWDAATGEVRRTIKHDGGLEDVAISSDENLVVTASACGALYVLANS